ncbi:hypothetical protein [Spirosoma validum]|uniref:Uncharacterized protein n=1 Tax=Spirosoma validum TaxID=2771355 RepID=A0A927AXI4_9BACT|nr:hypothetical protein [Spirosoma validum]MBD2751591.1 hypothetical protein [Spirosoma validum]
MKLTWTFYPKGEKHSVSLTVVYVPELDKLSIPSGGYLVITTNTAYVNWSTYKRFDTSDIEGRKDAFQQLTAVEEFTETIKGILANGATSQPR